MAPQTGYDPANIGLTSRDPHQGESEAIVVTRPRSLDLSSVVTAALASRDIMEDREGIEPILFAG